MNEKEKLKFNQYLTLLVMALAMVIVFGIPGCTGGASSGKMAFNQLPKKDRSKLPRTIITTDLEIDDMTGVMMSLMYADMFDIAGLVWSAGMFHWNGDGGVHTLGEITPNNRTPQVESDRLTSYRPVEPGWLNRMISENYAADYVYLSQNNPNYPTPEELLSVVKQGNIEFEGDVRCDTEGSDWIKQCVLDDDPRPLFIQSWGGANTWVRAFLSIYEDYKNTSQWETVRQKIIDKVYLMGAGEDNCMEDQKINEIYPGLHFYSGYGGSGGYGNYFAPNTAGLDVRHFYQADWITDAFKLNHGNVLGAWLLMGDGQQIWGEPDEFQYGLQTFIDFSSISENNVKHDLSRSVRQDFDIYDWQGCQFGNASFLTGFGLRGFVDGFPVNPNYGTIAGRLSFDGKAMNRAGNYNDNEYNPVTNAPGSYDTRFTTILFEELAARADWAVNTFEHCNHAPIVGSDNLDIYAKAGEVVDLRGFVVDPDGDQYHTKWWVWNAASEYDGVSKGRLDVWGQQPASTKFTVPGDAQPGDYFNVLMEVRDVAERPMTRFAQFIVHVYDTSTVPGDVTGISINTPADQTAYVVGKPLKVDGLTIKAQRADGEDLVVAVSNAMISGFDNYFIGSQNLTIKYGDFATHYMITVSPPALPATYAIYTNKPKNLVLETATEGYAERAPETITVSNKGKNALDLSISLSVRSANADAFVVSPGDAATLNAGNQTDRFAVRPVSGLAPGTYTADVVIMDKALNIKAPEFTVSFTVNPRR